MVASRDSVTGPLPHSACTPCSLRYFLGEFNPLCRLIAPKGTLWHVHYHVCALPYWDINVQDSWRRRLHLGAAVAGGEGTARRGAAESQQPLKSSLPPLHPWHARCFWGFASLRRCVFELSFTQRSSGSLNECSSKTARLKLHLFLPSAEVFGIKTYLSIVFYASWWFCFVGVHSKHRLCFQVLASQHLILHFYAFL